MEQDNDGSGEAARVPVAIEDEMRESYLAYAMSVIIGRALPDVRDGLKPVHRRVLFAMHEQRNVYNGPFKKSARIVGDVIGKYHPHGDTAVYDTMVRMAQPFSMRYTLVDGQGNFGSIDGDPPAAMRYTEVRMTRLSGELLGDIEKETVDWQDNYDGAEQEPVVLPAAFPNLLVNGSGGIAVGMATNMPPHNLSEVIAATIAVIEDPGIDVEELMAHVPGPDFPTGGFIFGRRGIIDAYMTGRGIIKVRARAGIELDDRGDEKAVVITELPYQVNKAKLLERIADLVRDKKIEGIRDLRDESDRRGMRVVVELKRGAIGQIVLNQLYALTPMQTSFGIINLAIVRGQPRVLNLKELLVHFINHRRDVVTRRCRYELRKANERAHVLEGYLIALDAIDEVIAVIKASATPPEAKASLVASFGLSEIQAQSILDMRLQRLTALEVDRIKAEYDELKQNIARLEAILGSDTLLMEVITDELSAVEERYGDVRRTQIVEDAGDINMEDLIADEDMVVTVTATGYIKRTALSEYRTQRRGGRGRSGMHTKSEDLVTNLFVASAHTLLLIFTNRGQVYPLKVWELPVGGINSSGKAIVNLIPLESDESVRSIVPVDNLEDDSHSVVFATRNGTVKRTTLSQYKNVRNSGIRAISLEEGNELVEVALAEEDDHVMLVTAKGQSIIFAIEDVRAMGRATRGVRGIRLRGDDMVVAMDVVQWALEEGEEADESEEADEVEELEEVETDADADAETEAEEEVEAGKLTVLLVTVNGYGKRTALSKFRRQNRGGLGLRALPFSERNGPLVAMCQVSTDADVMIVTDGGTIIRMPVADFKAYSRAAKGVRVISLNEGESVVSIHPVPPSDDEDENGAEELEGEEGLADGEESVEDGAGAPEEGAESEGADESEGAGEEE